MTGPLIFQYFNETARGSFLFAFHIDIFLFTF